MDYTTLLLMSVLCFHLEMKLYEWLIPQGNTSIYNYGLLISRYKMKYVFNLNCIPSKITVSIIKAWFACQAFTVGHYLQKCSERKEMETKQKMYLHEYKIQPSNNNNNEYYALTLALNFPNHVNQPCHLLGTIPYSLPFVFFVFFTQKISVPNPRTVPL